MKPHRQLLLAAVLLAGGMLAPASASAADRLDVLAEQLRDSPVAIDSEMSWFFTRADAARLERTLRGSPLDVYVVVLALLDADESGGDGERVAVGLHRRLERPGLYLVVDEAGYIDARAYSVPRQISLGYGIKQPPCCTEDPDVQEISGRVVQVVEDIADNPPGDTTDDSRLRPLKPYGYRPPYDPDASTREASLASAIMGGMLGLIAGGFARRNARRHAAESSPGTWCKRSGLISSVTTLVLTLRRARRPPVQIGMGEFHRSVGRREWPSSLG